MQAASSSDVREPHKVRLDQDTSHIEAEEVAAEEKVNASVRSTASYTRRRLSLSLGRLVLRTCPAHGSPEAARRVNDSSEKLQHGKPRNTRSAR